MNCEACGQERIATEVDVGRESEWCMALHGNHDEHQCHKKPGHADIPWGGDDSVFYHQCYCGVRW